jgi:hypothetical protein
VEGALRVRNFLSLAGTAATVTEDCRYRFVAKVPRAAISVRFRPKDEQKSRCADMVRIDGEHNLVVRRFENEAGNQHPRDQSLIG